MAETKTALSFIVNWANGSGSHFEWRSFVGAHEECLVVSLANGRYALKSPDRQWWLTVLPGCMSMLTEPFKCLERRAVVAGQENEPPGDWEQFTLEEGNRLVSIANPNWSVRLTTPPAPATSPIARLGYHGCDFYEGEQLWKFRGATGFSALQDWLDGKRTRVIEYATKLRARRVNTIRVFGMWQGTGFDPRVYGRDTYLNGLRSLMAEWGELGMRIFFTFSADQTGGSVTLPIGEWTELLYDAAEVVDDGAGLFEIENEGWKNGFRAPLVNPPPVGLCTRTAPAPGEPISTVGSVLQFSATNCPRVPGDWERRGKDHWEISWLGGAGPSTPTGKPAVGGETPRIAEGTNPREWADHVFITSIGAAGTLLHGGNQSAPGTQESNLQRCEFPGPGPALDCIQAADAAWQTIDETPELQLRSDEGEYSATHTANAVCEEIGAVRSYAKIRGNSATMIRVRETSPAVLKNGWQLDRKVGPHQQAYLLHR